jgi:predicted P-loop ATPase
MPNNLNHSSGNSNTQKQEFPKKINNLENSSNNDNQKEPPKANGHAGGEIHPAELFLSALDPTAKSFTFQTFDDNKERKEKRDKENKTRRENDQPHVRDKFCTVRSDSWSNLKPFLGKLNTDKAGIYVTINRTDGTGRKDNNITDIRAIFSDDDRTSLSLEDKIKGLPLEPTIIVETSPGKHQFSLCIDGPWPVDAQGKADYDGVFAKMQEYGCDPGAGGINRVGRVPGYYHNKGEPQQVKLLKTDGPRYTRAQILKAIPPIYKQKASKGQRGDSFGIKLENDEERAWYVDAFNKEASKLTQAVEGTRNNTLNKVAFSVGQIIAISDLDEDLAQEKLLEVATSVGLGETEALTTIENAMEAGFEKPLDRPYWVEYTGGIQKYMMNVFSFLDWLEVSLSYDLFADRYVVRGMSGYTELNDELVMELWRKAHKIGLRVEIKFLGRCLKAKALERQFHPVKEYLERVAKQWDGKPRIEEFFPTYAGVESNPYTRAVSRIFLTAAVRRIFEPGCKFDETPVLESPQGWEKSTFIRTLATRDDWFTDCLSLKDGPQKLLEQMQGKWFGEFAELKGARRGDTDHMKSQLSRQSDRARGAYKEFVKEKPRSFVTMGTINVKNEQDTYLNDITGNRRFWPMRMKERVNIDKLKTDLHQIWGEAVAMHKKGMPIRLPKELWQDAEKEQDKRQKQMIFQEKLSDYLSDLEGKILVEEVRRLLVGKGRWTNDDDTSMGIAMRELGWEKNKQLRYIGNKRTHYTKGDITNRLYVDDIAGVMNIKKMTPEQEAQRDEIQNPQHKKIQGSAKSGTSEK